MANLVIDQHGTPRCPRCNCDLTGVRHRAKDGYSVSFRPRVRCTGCGKRLAPARRRQYRQAASG